MLKRTLSIFAVVLSASLIASSFVWSQPNLPVEPDEETRLEEIYDHESRMIMFLYSSTGILSYASYKSLNEKSYTGVMAATGLSYLSLILSIGASGTLLLLA